MKKYGEGLSPKAQIYCLLRKELFINWVYFAAVRWGQLERLTSFIQVNTADDRSNLITFSDDGN